MVVVQANRAAARLGVRRGVTLTEARALVPGIESQHYDADADRRALEALAEWAGCLSPIVHIADDRSLLLDVTGCERLFQGEANLLARAIEGLRRMRPSAESRGARPYDDGDWADRRRSGRTGGTVVAQASNLHGGGKPGPNNGSSYSSERRAGTRRNVDDRSGSPGGDPTEGRLEACGASFSDFGAACSAPPSGAGATGASRPGETGRPIAKGGAGGPDAKGGMRGQCDTERRVSEQNVLGQGVSRQEPPVRGRLKQDVSDRGVARRGFSVRAAVADTPGAAWALAHAHPNAALVVEPGQTAAALAPLPVWSLRVDRATVESLAAVGVETVEALLHLPRSSLARRFGDGLLLRLDQVLGEAIELLTPFRPPPPVTSRLRFVVSTERRDIVGEALDRLFAEFCEQLGVRGVGVRRVCVTLYCDEGGPYTFEVNMSRATRSVKRLRSLAVARFEQRRVPSPVHTVQVWTRQTESLADWQDEFFETGQRDAEGLAELVDRLSVRLGPDGVVSPELVSEHQPEAAFRYSPVMNQTTGSPTTGSRSARARRSASRPARSDATPDGAVTGRATASSTAREGAMPDGAMVDNAIESPTPRDRASKRRASASRLSRSREDGVAASVPRENEVAGRKVSSAGAVERTGTGAGAVGRGESAVRGRPVRLWRRAMEVSVVALLPAGPPARFTWQGRSHDVVESIGPERIETGWWRGEHIQRDYFRVTTASGQRFWLYRDHHGGWFLHGLFD